MLSDMHLFLLYLSGDQKKELLEAIKQGVEAKSNNQVRYAKASIGYQKLRYITRTEQFADQEALLEFLVEPVANYHSFLTVDDKPEKGERKIVDECVLLISDIIDGFLQGKDPHSTESKSL